MENLAQIIPPPRPANNEVIHIATININGITAHTKAGRLADFVRQHDFDIIFVQEVMSPEVLNFRGYETHLNIETSMRGTAIVTKRQHPLTDFHTIPTRRALAANFQGIKLLTSTHHQAPRGMLNGNDTTMLTWPVYYKRLPRTS